MWADPQRPLTVVDCFFVKSAVAQHPTENTHYEGAVRIELERDSAFGNGCLPFAGHQKHSRKDGVRHRILIVERYCKPRLFERGVENIRNGARGIEPKVPE